MASGIPKRVAWAFLLACTISVTCGLWLASLVTQATEPFFTLLDYGMTGVKFALIIVAALIMPLWLVFIPTWKLIFAHKCTAAVAIFLWAMQAPVSLSFVALGILACRPNHVEVLSGKPAWLYADSLVPIMLVILAAVFAVSMILAKRAIVRTSRKIDDTKRGRCRKCGFSLLDLPGPCCPECGHSLPEPTAVRE